MNAVVDPEQIPYTDVVLSGITGGATKLRTVASAVRDGTADVVRAWGRISGSYEGPSDQELFAVMTPIGPQGTTFGDDLDAAAGALDTFVDEVTPIVAQLTAYKARAVQLVRDVAAFQPVTIQTMDGPVTQTESWDQDETLNGENNDIINGVANRVVEYQAAERKCANTIRALNGLPPLHAIGASGDESLGYGYDELPMGTELPWGTAESRKESCAEKTTLFLPKMVKGIVWDGVIVGTIGGLGELAGVRDWKWSADNFTDTWKSLGGLVGYDKETGEWGDGDLAAETWKAMGKGTVAWDKWADDPGTAFGESVWNIGSIFIPVANVAGKAGTAGKVGSIASGISKADRLLELADAGAWASKGLTKVLPKLTDLKSVLGRGFEHVLDGFATKIADFRTGFQEWQRSHHAETGSAVDEPRVRPEGTVDASVGANAHTHTDSVESNAPTPEREPALVGGGHGESATVHGGGSDSGSSGGGGHGTDAPTDGSGGASGGGGHGTDAGGGTPDRGHQVDPTESFGKVPYGDGVANHAGPGGTALADDLTRPGADLPDGVTRLPDNFSHAPEDALAGDTAPRYGDAYPDHGSFNPAYAAPGDPEYTLPDGTHPEADRVNSATERLLTSGPGPDGYYGHHSDGTPLTRAEYVERYIQPDGRPRYPDNDGAVPGSRIEFEDPTLFGRYFSTTIDRMGGDSGGYFAFPGTSFEQRGLPPTNLRAPYSVFELDTDALRANGFRIQVSRIDPAFAQPGGGLQIQIIDPVLGEAVTVQQMLEGVPDLGWEPALVRKAAVLQ